MSACRASANRRAALRRAVAGGRRGCARGATIAEFIVVAPVLLFIVLLMVHYGLLFTARNQVNHAAFMAARAGTVQHANANAIRQAYLDAIVPLYGGGEDAVQLAESRQRANEDANEWVEIEILNPRAESFDDWSDPDLSIPGFAGRTIPNAGIENRSLSVLGATSNQNIQDANLLKIRVWHAYPTKVPLVTARVLGTLAGLAGNTDARFVDALEQGRWPIVSHVTMQMQTEPVE